MHSILKFLSLSLAVLMIFGCTVACTPSEGDTDPTIGESSEETLASSDTSNTASNEGSSAVSEQEPSSETAPEEPDEPSVKTRPAQEVKVISMNLDANEATASSRVKIMAPLLLSFDPDSIGVQECRGGWISLLKRNFLAKGYARVGVDAGGGQDASNGYFATYILYKEDKFNLVDSGTFWLSQTPDVPSKYGPTVDTNRTCTWALLEDKVTGFRYVHMNCHLDWMDMSVNQIQVEMIREQIERFEAMGYPVFAGGDYNCDEGTDSYYKMLDSDVVDDSKKIAEKANDIATYPSYGEYDVYDPKERPIDYFFVTKEHMTVKEYRVVDEKPDGKYISDHFPVFVHALVHEMSVMDETLLLPAFEVGSSIKAELSDSKISLSFPQANNAVGVLASHYRIELLFGEKIIQTRTLASGVLKLETSESLQATVSGMNESGTYTVRVTPVNIFGDDGTPQTAEVEFSYNVTSGEMPVADIVDIRVEGNTPVDHSVNGYEVTSKGTTPIVETEYGKGMDFNKNTNFMVRGVQNHYNAMAQGFTMEILFTTGEDITSFQSLVSNMHAGGYGVDWENGKITFSVRIGSSYVGPSADIETNTTYHLVGVFSVGKVSLYLNGVLMGQTEVNGNMLHPTDAGAEYLCIGADSDATGTGEYPIDATVYLVRMYTAVASDGQALYLYENLNK